MPARFIATADIYVGTALAHAAGDTVPAENVDLNGWQDLVAREGTKAADEVAPEPPKRGRAPR